MPRYRQVGRCGLKTGHGVVLDLGVPRGVCTVFEDSKLKQFQKQLECKALVGEVPIPSWTLQSSLDNGTCPEQEAGTQVADLMCTRSEAILRVMKTGPVPSRAASGSRFILQAAGDAAAVAGRDHRPLWRKAAEEGAICHEGCAQAVLFHKTYG